MYLNTLQRFRQEVYGCFERAADALFNTADALLTETSAQSFAELALSPNFERRWPSLYEAFEDGRIAHERLGRVFVGAVPAPSTGRRLWIGVDASSIPRPEAETSADRTVVYTPSAAGGKRPISSGWQFSTVVVLPESPSSWTYVLDQRRIGSQEKSTQVAAQQLHQVIPQLVEQGYQPIITSDRWYCCVPFLSAIADLQVGKLLRAKRNQVFYRAAPAPTGKRGAPRKDGERLQCSDPATHGEPDKQWQGSDEHGHLVEVACWGGLHLRRARHITLTLIQVIRHGASEKPRDPRVSWFVWIGPFPLPLEDVVPGYQRRYSQEHGYRFEKQALLWGTPRLRTPEQFERWSDVVACVQNQLVLARELGQVVYRPWEKRRSVVTPQQVRRAMPQILRQLGTPAKPPKVRGKSPGRSKGTQVRPAPRYEVVRKAKKKPKTPLACA